ncbi:MAG: hypothetical protein ABIR68_02580 [Ilumatobacteraceae bacterium]
MTSARPDDGLLRTELRALRLGAGASPARILASGELYERLGRPPTGEVIATLKARLAELGDDQETAALASALALNTDEGADRRLAGRRTAFARRSGLMPDVIERFESTAINRLVELLITSD